MIILKILKNTAFALIDILLVLLGNTKLLLGSIIQNIGYGLLTLFPIFIIGIFTSSLTSILVFIPALLIVILIFYIVGLLITVFTQISAIIGAVSSVIATFIFGLRHKLEFKYTNEITHETAQNKWLHIPFGICHIAKAFYYASIFIIKYLIVLAIIISLGIIGYFIYSCNVDFNEPIAKFIIEKLDYFATPYVLSNVICIGFLVAGVIAILIMTTLNLRTFAIDIHSNRLEDYYILQHQSSEPIKNNDSDSDKESYLILSEQNYLDLMAGAYAQGRNNTKEQLLH